jgi:hypothetical protein
MARSKRGKIGFEPTQAYTVDRLKKALRLYQHSKSHIERRGLPHSYLGSYLRSSYYDLRIRQSNLEPIDIDCDDDSDGNYSPKSRKKRKRNNAKPAELSLPEQVQPQKLVIIFHFKSITAKMFLHKLAHSAVFSDLVEDSNDIEEEKKVSQAQKKPPASVRRIRTAYCHPLDCELGNNNGEPCEFCRNFTFGMFGLGLKEVTVADYGRGCGLEEVEGGHQSAGHERTRICHNCCLDRQYITICPGHKFSPLPGLDPLTFDFGKAFRSLEKKTRGYEQVNQWCSLCLNPAFFRCSTELFIDKFARDIEGPSSPEASGCGILLCDSCKVLMERHGNDLARVVSSIPASEGVRADVEFLLPGSSLHRYFCE